MEIELEVLELFKKLMVDVKKMMEQEELSEME